MAWSSSLFWKRAAFSCRIQLRRRRKLTEWTVTSKNGGCRTGHKTRGGLGAKAMHYRKGAGGTLGSGNSFGTDGRLAKLPRDKRLKRLTHVSTEGLYDAPPGIQSAGMRPNRHVDCSDVCYMCRQLNRIMLLQYGSVLQDVD